MTGFRVAYGGAQAVFGIKPDLTTLGKIIGGGLPVGAYGGRADIMDHVLPAGKVFQAGTLSGNPAGHGRRHRHAQGPPRHESLPAARAPLRAAGRRAGSGGPGGGHSLHVGRFSSMMTLFFNAGAGHRLGHGQPHATRSATPGTSGA